VTGRPMSVRCSAFGDRLMLDECVGATVIDGTRSRNLRWLEAEPLSQMPSERRRNQSVRIPRARSQAHAPDIPRVAGEGLKDDAKAGGVQRVAD
jgi:hypothetical protein